MDKIIKSLKGEGAILVVILFAFGAQMPHAYSVFISVAHGTETAVSALLKISAVLYAIALEIATLVFVARGRVLFSIVFAVVSVAVNLSYYFAPDGSALTMILISLALPLAIALYSHELSHDGGIDIKMPSIAGLLPMLFASTANVDESGQAQDRTQEPIQELTQEPIPVQMPAPKPEPVAVEAKPKESDIVGANGRFHGLDASKRTPLVKKMKKEHGYTNKKLGKIFAVDPATISRDLNS